MFFVVVFFYNPSSVAFLRYLHGPDGRPLPGDRRAGGPARREGGGGPVGVQPQHPEAGVQGLPVT